MHLISLTLRHFETVAPGCKVPETCNPERDYMLLKLLKKMIHLDFKRSFAGFVTLIVNL